MFNLEAVFTGIIVLAAVITSLAGLVSIYDRFFANSESQNGKSPPCNGEDS